MAFGELTNTVDDQILGVRFAVEYMIWPNCFEPAASQNHRKMRTDAYGWEIGGPRLGPACNCQGPGRNPTTHDHPLRREIIIFTVEGMSSVRYRTHALVTV